MNYSGKMKICILIGTLSVRLTRNTLNIIDVHIKIYPAPPYNDIFWCTYSVSQCDILILKLCWQSMFTTHYKGRKFLFIEKINK